MVALLQKIGMDVWSLFSQASIQLHAFELAASLCLLGNEALYKIEDDEYS